MDTNEGFPFSSTLSLQVQPGWGEVRWLGCRFQLSQINGLKFVARAQHSPVSEEHHDTLRQSAGNGKFRSGILVTASGVSLPIKFAVDRYDDITLVGELGQLSERTEQKLRVLLKSLAQLQPVVQSELVQTDPTDLSDQTNSNQSDLSHQSDPSETKLTIPADMPDAPGNHQTDPTDLSDQTDSNQSDLSHQSDPSETNLTIPADLPDAPGNHQTNPTDLSDQTDSNQSDPSHQSDPSETSLTNQVPWLLDPSVLTLTGPQPPADSPPPQRLVFQQELPRYTITTTPEPSPGNLANTRIARQRQLLKTLGRGLSAAVLMSIGWGSMQWAMGPATRPRLPDSVATAPEQLIPIVLKADGLLEQVNVVVGQTIRVGDSLARFSHPVDPNTLKKLEFEIATVATYLSDQTAELERLTAQVERIRLSLDQTEASCRESYQSAMANLATLEKRADEMIPLIRQRKVERKDVVALHDELETAELVLAERQLALKQAELASAKSEEQMLVSAGVFQSRTYLQSSIDEAKRFLDSLNSKRDQLVQRTSSQDFASPVAGVVHSIDADSERSTDADCVVIIRKKPAQPAIKLGRTSNPNRRW
ncbi:hypothetical protein LOC67_14995 [Stieleria sp. JC731]|uniref:hypothetical protein n=1 Tax=Pirellulaceae TaxID=2691357 RepID=UPI001E59561A|nr:hypothetical protein [Stieleria sp. JC731]MCC9601866.1 hypothetical protein [Stieleria sp. JC731]